MALNYTKKTLDHFLKPRNIGKIAKPDGYAQIGNMVCGDQLDFFLKVEKGKIKDVKFLSFGCASNIATASVMTEKLKGMSIEAAKGYAWQKIVDDLGGLPHQKVHCSVMAVQGLKKAIADYEKRAGLVVPVKTAKVEARSVKTKPVKNKSAKAKSVKTKSTLKSKSTTKKVKSKTKK